VVALDGVVYVGGAKLEVGDRNKDHPSIEDEPLDLQRGCQPLHCKRIDVNDDGRNVSSSLRCGIKEI
jgi:hypothetical protein